MSALSIIFVSGILSAIDLHLLFLHWRKTLVSWHCNETIQDIEILAVLGLVLGLAFSGWYIFLFLYENLRKYLYSIFM